MVENIEDSMINRIQSIEWFDGSTKKHAMKKVMKIL